MKGKPPPGVMPLWHWQEEHPDPSVGQLLERYVAVSKAVARYRAAGWYPSSAWLEEVLGHLAFQRE